MKKQLSGLILPLLLFLYSLSSPTYAKQDGNDLLTGCSGALRILEGQSVTPEQAALSARCLGFIEGFLGANAISPIQSNGQQILCLPEEVSGVQVARILVKWLKENPEVLHQDAVMLFAMSLAEAFPCNYAR